MKTGSHSTARNSSRTFGWEAGIRTPIGGSRVRKGLFRSVSSNSFLCLRVSISAKRVRLSAAQFRQVSFGWHTAGTLEF